MKENLRICIVDDDEIHHFIMKKLLQGIIGDTNDYVEPLFNGEEALQFFIKEYATKYSYLVLLDIDMPIMDGWDFLESFKKYFENIPDNVHIYIFSSSRDPNDTKRVKQYKFVHDYILKPISSENLKTIIDQF